MAVGFGQFVMTGVNRHLQAKMRRAALTIVNDLQAKGPYWDGLFYDAWEVQAGDVTISADQQGYSEEWWLRPKKTHPKQGSFALGDIPEQTVNARTAPVLTIGNRMVYRDVALDLVPGRIKNGGNETAPQDWYMTYVDSVLPQRVKEALRTNINLPGRP